MRPEPNILLEIIDENENGSEQVLASDGIYSVFYQGRPINLRKINLLTNPVGTKYRKVSFSNAGHAFNLAERLNKMFETTGFAVVKFTDWRMVHEGL